MILSRALSHTYASRRAKFRLPNFEKRPLIEPMLPIVEVVVDPAPESVVNGAMVLPFANESRGEPSEIVSLFAASAGPDDTPLKPCRARCARWRCKGVCLVDVKSGVDCASFF